MINRWLVLALALAMMTACSLPGRTSLQKLGTIDSSPQDVAFSPDGSLLAVRTGDEGVRIWRVVDKTLVTSLGQGRVNAIAFSPDGALLAAPG